MTTVSNMAIVERARVLLAATGNGELSLTLQERGIDAALLQLGHVLYERCDQTYRVASDAYAARTECTAALQSKSADVRDHYKKLAQTARAIYAKDRGMQQRMGITHLHRIIARPSMAQPADGSTEQPSIKTVRRETAGLDIFLSSARHLYATVLDHPAIQAELAKAGYTVERLHQERMNLATLESFDVEQERLKAVAKARTVEHSAAVAELQEWLSRFSGIVMPALSDRPDLLMAMGLKPRGRKAAA